MRSSLLGILVLLSTPRVVSARTWPFDSTVPGHQSMVGTFGEFRLGRLHGGVDIDACTQPVRAAVSGRARFHPRHPSNGFWVELNGFYRYLHLQQHRPAIMQEITATGQPVERDVVEEEPIGISDATGFVVGVCRQTFLEKLPLKHPDSSGVMPPTFLSCLPSPDSRSCVWPASNASSPPAA